MKVLGAPEPPAENFAEWLEAGTNDWNLQDTRACLQNTRQHSPLAAAWENLNGEKAPETVLLFMHAASEEKILSSWQYAQKNNAHLQAVFTTAMIAEGSAFAKADLLKSILTAEDQWSIGIAIPGYRLGQVGLVRMLVSYLDKIGIAAPLIWRYQIPQELINEGSSTADWMLDASSQLGALLCDGLGDAILAPKCP